MLKIHKDETMSICQGDNNSFVVSFDNHMLTDKNKIVFIVKDNLDNIIIEKDVETIQDNRAFFEFKKHETLNVTCGTYTYFIGFKCDEEFTLISNRKFIIESGVVNEF